MIRVSTFGSSASMTSIFPETLAPPMIATNGRFGALDRVAEEVELLLHQVARRPLGQVHAHHRAVGPVGGAEGVVDVDVAELRERGAEGLDRRGVGLHRAAVVVLDLALLLDVEAEVLEQHHLARLQRGAGRLHLGADAVVELLHRLAEELGEPRGHRREAELVAALPVGAAEVAHEHQARALVEHVLDGGQRRAQPLVVLDRAVLEGDVEVDAHDDALAAEVEVLDEELGHGPSFCPESEREIGGDPPKGRPRGMPGTSRGSATRTTTSRRPSSPCSGAGRSPGWSSPTRCRTS